MTASSAGIEDLRAVSRRGSVGGRTGGTSPHGECRGGRQKGTPNRATAAKAAAIIASGLTPWDYLLSH